MNNIFYAWNNDLTAKAEMEERRREIDNIHLLREAGLTNPGWIERFLIAVGSSLAGYGKKLKGNRAQAHQPYQVTSDKLAS